MSYNIAKNILKKASLLPSKEKKKKKKKDLIECVVYQSSNVKIVIKAYEFNEYYILFDCCALMAFY